MGEVHLSGPTDRSATMLFRFLAFGLLLALVYRFLRNLFGPLLMQLFGGGPEPGDTRTPSSPERDETKIRDAEFRDLNS